MPDFKLTLAEFEILKSILPSKYELPIKLPLTQLFGGHSGVNSLLKSRAGVYKFTHKINGNVYRGWYNSY